jgi:hypothetical protein
VRFLIRDVAAPFLLLDEEIDNQIAFETATGDALPFYTAAHLLETLLVQWTSAGQGLSEKQVGKLRLSFGLGERGAGGDTIQQLIDKLKIEGSRRLQPAPHRFRTLSTLPT